MFQLLDCVSGLVPDCVSASVLECVPALVLDCVPALVLDCVPACVSALMLDLKQIGLNCLYITAS